MIQLVTDSSADLPRELLDRYNIVVVPLTITIDEKDYLEGIDITPQEFFVKMSKSKELPKTSQPSPAAFAEVFKNLSQNGDILCLTISSGLSGTYSSACMGQDLSQVNAAIFDTQSGSLGHGLQLIEAAKLIEKNYSMEEIIEYLEDYRKNQNIFILLDTLENIVKGGRLSKFQGTLTKVLDIKVFLEGIEGKVEIKDKIRGKKRFLKKTIEIIGERKGDFSDTVFGITHVNNITDAEYIKEQIIEKYHPKDVMINYMGATMGTYAGDGGMIISFR